jgi:hypothetical protein
MLVNSSWTLALNKGLLSRSQHWSEAQDMVDLAKNVKNITCKFL